LRELFGFEPDHYVITANGTRVETRALLIAIANSRQYGNGATIAPQARVDDGVLDVVIVGERSPWTAMVQIPALFSGKADRLPGVTVLSAAAVEFCGSRPVVYHLDGEPAQSGKTLQAKVHPGALHIRVPTQ